MYIVRRGGDKRFGIGMARMQASWRHDVPKIKSCRVGKEGVSSTRDLDGLRRSQNRETKDSMVRGVSREERKRVDRGREGRGGEEGGRVDK